MSTLKDIIKTVKEINKSDKHKQRDSNNKHNLHMFYKEGRQEEFKEYQDRLNKSE